MTDHNIDIDKVLRDAIDRMGNKEPGAGLSEEVGDAISRVAGETPPGTQDATDIERIQGNHTGGPGKCRGVGPGDLNRVREIYERNVAHQQRNDLDAKLPKAQEPGDKPSQRKNPLRL